MCGCLKFNSLEFSNSLVLVTRSVTWIVYCLIPRRSFFDLFRKENQDVKIMNESGKLRNVTAISERSPLLISSSYTSSNDARVDVDKCSRTVESTKKFIHKYVPITVWLPNYSCDSLIRDIIAGLTVGLMVVPQGLAYATIANLPVQYGLYSAYLGCFMYCVFGGSKDVTLGPTAIMSLMVAQYAAGEPLHAVALAFYCGIVQFLLGVFRLGFMVRFISLPVISGFVSAAAVTIGFGQVKNLLGLKHIPRAFIPNVIETFKHIKGTNPWDLLLGSCCILLLVLLKKLNGIKWDDDGNITTLQRACRKFVWLLTTARNALVVMIATAIVIAVDSASGRSDTFSLTADITAPFPDFEVGIACLIFLLKLG